MKYEGVIRGERLGVGEVNVYIDDPKRGFAITSEMSLFI